MRNLLFYLFHIVIGAGLILALGTILHVKVEWIALAEKIIARYLMIPFSLHVNLDTLSAD